MIDAKALLLSSDERKEVRGSERTTLPGLRLLLRQVEVSVVQQLKHRRLTRSESLVAASSVWTIWTVDEIFISYQTPTTMNDEQTYLVDRRQQSPDPSSLDEEHRMGDRNC